MWESATSLCNRRRQTTVCRTCEQRPCSSTSAGWQLSASAARPTFDRRCSCRSPRHCLHELLTLMESTRSSTRNRRLTSAMLLLSLARTMSLYLWTISSDSATSSARYCLKDKAEKKKKSYGRVHRYVKQLRIV